MQQESTVLIVGAGPAGLATSACLNLKNIPNLVLEKEDCSASLWRKRSYDRLKLHLAKQFCELPHMSFPPNSPTFVSKNGFIQYLDHYASYFNINPFYHRVVERASFNEKDGKWVVDAKNILSNTTEVYLTKFLIVATGENSEGYIPHVPGLDSFNGELMHSNHYKNGKSFCNKNVLVVGSGNSGMEIAFDLSNWGAKTSIAVRSPVHILTEIMVQLGMTLLKYLPLGLVDKIVVTLSKLKYGNLSEYGIQRPSKGPFYLKMATGRSAVIDVGVVPKIQAHEVNVFPSVKEVNGDCVHFSNGDVKSFDAIVFATGYRSTVKKWLTGEVGLFNEEGMPKKRSPNHWKGENGLYCIGFARSGLFGISNDAKAVAQDISVILHQKYYR